MYAAQTTSGPWVSVFNANGTVRYSRAVTGTNASGMFPDADRLDAAIAADGRVIVVFDAGNNDTNNTLGLKVTQARIFDPCGNPLGPVFYVSEKENATNAIVSQTDGRPRVAWRGNLIATYWGSQNDLDLPSTKVVGLRLFNAPPPSGPTIQQVSPGQVKISWTGCGVLQASSDLIAWADVSPTAVSPYSPSSSEAKKFYRLRYF